MGNIAEGNEGLMCWQREELKSNNSLNRLYHISRINELLIINSKRSLHRSNNLFVVSLHVKGMFEDPYWIRNRQFLTNSEVTLLSVFRTSTGHDLLTAQLRRISISPSWQRVLCSVKENVTSQEYLPNAPPTHTLCERVVIEEREGDN